MRTMHYEALKAIDESALVICAMISFFSCADEESTFPRSIEN